MMRRTGALLFLLGFGADGWADPLQLGGHVQYQISATRYSENSIQALYGVRDAVDQDISARFKLNKQAGPWAWSMDYHLLGNSGGTREFVRRVENLSFVQPFAKDSLPSDRTRWWNLTYRPVDGQRAAVEHRIDRLILSYTGEALVLKLGRQAITWGNGLVFHALDFFNPFSPTMIEGDYKVGDDMVYGQFLFSNGSDVQAVVVPRRDSASHRLESDASSVALKWHGNSNSIDYDVVLARHYGENRVGIGLAGELGGYVLRTDVVVSLLNAGGNAVTLLSNVDHSWAWRGHNLRGYVEYFRNGVGIAAGKYAALSAAPELLNRLGRGEIFTVARDYLTGGMSIDITGLLKFTPAMVWNLNDGGSRFLLRFVYDASTNIQVLGGLGIAHGQRDTEYGGLPIQNCQCLAAPGNDVFVRIRYSF